MDELTLSIGDLARRTGVDIPTLRRWERYEGLLAPTRTPGGQRRYGAADVAAVQELVSLMARGWAIESAARAVADHRDTGALVFDATLLDAVPAGVVVTNAAQEVLYANPAIGAMLGVTPAELEAAGGRGVLDDEQRGHVLAAFEHGQGGEAQAYEVRMRTRSGDEIDVEIAAGPMLGPDGGHRGVVGVLRDVGRSREAAREIDVLTRLVDATAEALLVVDADLRVVRWNAAAATSVPDLATGSSLTELLPRELAAPTAAAVGRAIAGEPSTFELHAGDRALGDQPLQKQVRVLPLDLGHGDRGAIVVAVDVVPQPEAPPDTGTSTAYHGVVAALTQSILAGEPATVVLDTAVRGVSRALDATYVAFVEVRRPGGELEVVASTVEEPTRSAAGGEPFGSHVGFTLHAQRPIVVPDFDAERRFDRGPFAGEQAARSGLCAPVRWRPDGLGAISVHATVARQDLGPTEVTFVQSAANVCALAMQGRDGLTPEERP